MDICYTNDKNINLRWRDSENNRVETKVENFRPYFFIRAIETEVDGYEVTHTFQGRKAKLWFPFEYENGNWVNLQGQLLKKVYVHSPNDMYKARDCFMQTYEADVSIIDRYCVDELKDIPEFKMRKMYWDMEWMADDLYDGAITCIVAYDNYDKQYYQWIWFPNQDPYNGFKMSTKEVAHMSVFNSEKEMLDAFLTYIEDKDPDMLLAWFGLKYDLPKLIHRCIANDLDPRRLSPYNEVKGVIWNDGVKATKAVDDYYAISQPIRGRLTLNLDLAFERQWSDAQKGTLPSMALDDIAEMALGKKKLVSEKFPDKNEFFRRGWLEDTNTYLEYAKIDVELLVELDETNFCSDAIIYLQRILKAPFKSCMYVSMMGAVYFMRNATWKAPTGDKSVQKINYDGAMIYDPTTEKTHGLHLNVAALDFAGLYPSMMIARNISWETKSKEPTEFAVNIATPRDFSPTKSKVMRYYKTDKLGLLPKSVLELKELRNEYKRRMYLAREQGNTMEYNKWFVNQMAVKRLSASFYGVIGKQGFGWGDIDLAASITASAREAIRSAALEVKRMVIMK